MEHRNDVEGSARATDLSAHSSLSDLMSSVGVELSAGLARYAATRPGFGADRIDSAGK